MENEQPTLENTEAAPAAAPKTRTTRSRRATSAVTSPGTAAAAPAEAETPAKKAPVRRSRAKKSDSPLSSSAAEAEAPSVSDAGLSLLDANSEKTGSEAAANDVAAPAKKAPRRRASAPVTAPVSGEVAGQGELILTGGAPATVVPEEDAPARKVPVRRSRAAKAPVTKVAAEQHADTGVVEVQATAEVATEMADAPKAATSRTRSTSRRASAKAADVAAPEAAQESVSEVAAATEEAPVQVAAAVAPKATRSRRRSSAPTSTPASAASAVTAAPAEAAVPTVTGAPAEETGANSEEAAQEPVEAPQAIDAPEQAEPAVTDSLFHAPDSGISALFLAPDLSLVVPVATTHGGNPEENTQDGADADQRGRSRNRNRRPRAADTQPVDESQDADVAESDSDDSDDGVTSRRRRRRRRGDTDLELTGGSDEDPPNTVTRVRAPRVPAEPTASVSNRVTSLRGSTRLEAKKQRRRDSRDSGRRRTVITEAEFLARRESVDRVMVVRQADDRIQIGVLEDGILAEHFVSKTQQDSLIGNVYVGKVQNVLPSMEAAFVDIGRGRNAVLYAGEVDWDAADLNGQPRRIENALKSGDSVLVQVSKDPVGHKGARLTSQISLPGRYLVFVPGGSMTGISRKLPDVERNRLKRVLKDHLPENAGVIVRTAAEGASEEELTNDINRLRAQWEGINNRAASSKTLAPEMLYGEPDLTIKVVRDVFNEDFSKLIVSGEDAWDTIEAYVTYVAPDLLDRLEKWTNPEDIFSAHRIDEQINKALERKVFLPSGGSLVIDRTEAMTVVDVNTGKFTGSGGNLEETVTKNNLEAAEEVVRQLRLRDIGGIIVIDFIDMVLESNRDLVLRRLVECLGRDRTKHQVAEVTSLGLIQMTRKRMGTGLLEVFGEQCGTCAGRGMVTHEIPVEHRRPHTPGVEGAQVQAQVHAPTVEQREPERTANRSTRSERKRNRNRTQGNEAEQHQETPVTPLSDEAAEALEAAKAQKAHEARAALANIAAAAAATHHEHSPAQGHHQAADASEQHVMHDAGILTLGGEAIELPRGHRSESGGMVAHNNADQAAALAGLTQALDQLSAPGAEHSAPEHSTPEPSTHEPKVAEAEESGSNRSRARRGRRNRSARSAQGGADMTVETSEAPVTSQGSAPHSSAQVHISAPAPVVHKSAEPIILGVGVPASEL
ncbi:Rne/Rng family ribonuclease [Arthrobacter psychrochitiniphilus]|uniref:Rne/Rng family ribonuclease n=1 Tax=Arthrobacter psychrochitiniphilus TaxID=291045 RepID=UPI003F7BC4AE